MGSQRVKEEAQKEAPAEKKEEKEKKTVKKWKGKDWFVTLAPKMFNEKVLGEVPTTDPKGLVDRVLDFSLSEIIGNPSKYYIKFRFRIDRVEGNRAYTTFNGYNVIKEQVFRMVRKRLQKVEVVNDVKTKDGWELHLKTILMLNKNTENNIQRKARLHAVRMLGDFASKSSLDDFVKSVSNGIIQKSIKKTGSKIYPIRICEVVKIGVLKAPGK